MRRDIKPPSVKLGKQSSFSCTDSASHAATVYLAQPQQQRQQQRNHGAVATLSAKQEAVE